MKYCWEIPSGWSVIFSNPQLNPQNAVSCSIVNDLCGPCSPRGLVSCETYEGAAVTAEVASSSLVVPASFFNNLQLGTFGIWVQLGCNRFSGFPCGHQMHRNNCLNQSRLGFV